MPDAYCLLNHELTAKQREELFQDFGVERVVAPPAEAAALWGNMPTGASLSRAALEPITGWLAAAAPGSVVVLQGEAGAAFALVDFALGRGLAPVYAVTARVARESREGEKVLRSYVFEHVRFRTYRRYADLPARGADEEG